MVSGVGAWKVRSVAVAVAVAGWVLEVEVEVGGCWEG